MTAAPRMRVHSTVAGAAALWLSVCAWAGPQVTPSPSAAEPAPAPKAPSFMGVDRFDTLRSVEELGALETEVRRVADRVRPTVVLLRSKAGRGVSSGSGVIIGKGGLVATCGHVGVRPGREVEAVLSDGTVLQGRTLGQVFAGGVDVGLVQLDTGGRALPAAPIGTTVGLAKGDWILAFGHTHGMGDDVRPALLRVGRVLANQPNELMMDAPIDAGDSGGPSFNLQGELVGLNSRCGRPPWENIAAPIDDLVSRMDELLVATGEEGAPTERRRRRGGSRPTVFPSGGSDMGKLAVQRSAHLGTVVEKAEAGVVRVLVEGQARGLGTVVDSRGLVLTKASLLPAGAPVEVESSRMQRHTAIVAARDAGSDLALLVVRSADPGELQAVQWADQGEVVQPGTAVVTPRWKPDGPALGFVGIEERATQRDGVGRPYLGVRTVRAEPEALEAIGASQGVRVEVVMNDSAAEKAGLRVGDLVLSFDGVEVASPEALRAAIGRRTIGERVEVRTARGSDVQTTTIELAPRPVQAGGQRRGNTMTAISGVSAGLGEVIPHDSITTPEQMGGPVLDLSGRAVGVNIARYDRTSTHAVPAERAREVTARLIEEARQAAKAAKAAQPSEAK